MSIETEKPWVKPLEAFINDEESFVIKQRRVHRNLRICTSKEANFKDYTPSEGVDELNRLAAFNTNELDIHGFLYDRCTLDIFREIMPDSHFKSQSMKFMARIIYLIDWFVNSLKDDELYKTSYNSLYHKQFYKIAQYNDHKDFDRRFITSEEFRTLPAAEHMAMIREDLENSRSFKNGIKEYDLNDLTKFVVSYVYSVLEKDYDTNRKVNEGTIPDWLMNFTSSTATSMGKTVLDWDEVDDDSIFDGDTTILRALRMIAQFATYPDIDDSDIPFIFKEDDIKIASINILSYIHALMSYGIAIYNTFIAEQLRSLWCYPDCIVDYIYSIYQHARIDEAMIRYSSEITRVAIALDQASMNELLTKLETPTPSNPMPYNVPFSTPNNPSSPPILIPGSQFNPSAQPPYLNMRLNQLETTVNSLVGENAELKGRIEKLEKKNRCPHEDYVKYVYSKGFPKTSEEILNGPKFDAFDMIPVLDDGTVITFACRLCGNTFKVDRRKIPGFCNKG